jgi:hypothetical protein
LNRLFFFFPRHNKFEQLVPLVLSDPRKGPKVYFPDEEGEWSYGSGSTWAGYAEG